MEFVKIFLSKCENENFIHRARLVNLIEESNKKIIIIFGEPGIGKSTLVIDYLKTFQLCDDSIWYNLSSIDNQPYIFLNNLFNTLFNYKSNYYNLNYKKNKLSLDNKDNLIKEISNFFDKKVKNISLIFDDVQRVNNPETIELISYISSEILKKNIKLFIISRSYPQDLLSKISISEEFLILDGDNLSFTVNESQQLFNKLYNLDLGYELIEKITDLCEGWVNGISLVADSIYKKENIEKEELFENLFKLRTLSSIENYFSKNIFQELDHKIKNIIIKLSIFSDFNPDLIKRISKDDPQNLINYLKKNNLFLKVINHEKNIFRFQKLFARFLQEQFNFLSKKEKIITHKIAAEYYENNNNIDKSFYHSILSNNFKKAFELFLIDVDKLLKEGKYDAIQKKINAFPENIKLTDPLIRYYYSIITNLTQPIESRKTLLSLIPYFRDSFDWIREAKIYELLLTNYLFYQESKEQVLDIIKKCENFLKLPNNSISFEKKEMLGIFIHLGQCWTTPESEKSFEMALKAEETSIKFHDERALLLSRIILSRLYLDRGKFYESKNILEMAEKHLENSEATRHYELLLRYYLGDTYFYLGEINSAVLQVKKGLKTTFYNYAAKRYLELNLALYLLYTENIEEAENIIELISSKEMGDNLMLHYYNNYLLQMLLSYRKNNQERAFYYCKRLMENENEKLLMTDYPYSYLALSEVNIYLKNYEEAILILKKILNKNVKIKYPYPYVTALSLMGYSLYKRGNKKEAKNYFERMFTILGEKNYKNLDICNPYLLNEISNLVSKKSNFNNFSRIIALQNSNKKGIVSNFSVYFQTLGKFNIYVDKKDIPVEIMTKYKKPIYLLKLLLTYRRSGLPRDVICDKIWKGYSSKSSKNNLNTTISRLRKIFNKKKNIIITDGDIIILNREVYRLDVDEFVDYYNEGNGLEKMNRFEDALQAYLNAISIYKGDFFQNDLYDDDIETERERLKNIYQNSLLKITKIYLGIENYLNAISYAKLLINKDPLCEAAYRLLMIASALSGNRSEIPKIFNNLTIKLTKYLNIDPDPKTIQLKEKLLSGIVPSPKMWEQEIFI